MSKVLRFHGPPASRDVSRRTTCALTRTLAASALCVLSACSGGGSGDGSGGGAIAGLSIAEEISVVTVDPTAGGSGSATVTPGAGEGGGPPAGSDYAADKTSAHVYDSSMETLESVNGILCMLTQTGYADLVNAATYNAQIDENKCEQGGDGSSSETGQSAGAGGSAPQIWIVSSTRASSTSPQTVDFWVPQHEDDATVHARMTITGAATSHNPFGTFTLDFAGVPAGGDIEDLVFFGTLATLDVLDGSIGFTFYEEHGDVTVVQAEGEHAESTQACVLMESSQTTGVAFIEKQRRSTEGGIDSGLEAESYRIAFDVANVLRAKDLDAPVCLSRTEFDQNVWSYNLYDAVTGARVDLDSGFGFETEDGAYGWIGYHGLWVEGGVELASGDTVTKQVYGSSAVETYTLVKAPGKLIRNTRHTLALDELEGETFTWWSFPSGGGPPVPGPTQYRVEYVLGMFNKTAQLDPVTQQWIDIVPAEPIDTAAIGFLGMWSESLGGSVAYVDGDDFVTYYAQEFVTAASDLFLAGDEVALYGYVDCLKAEITGAEAEQGQVFLANANDLSEPHEYVFDADDLTLYHDTDGTGNALAVVGLADGEEPAIGPFTWGMHSGPLVTSTAGLASPFGVWSEDVFYVYETGHNAWNQHAALLDAFGAAVVFDPPIQFTYTHATPADLNGDATYDGKKYFLAYNGPGSLFGIPSEGVDTDADGGLDRWYPLFSIADGTVMGPDGDEYVVKAIAKELTLAVDAAGCAGLSLDDAALLSLPDGSGFTPPDIGPPPTIDAAPQVVEGVVQGG